MNELIEIHASKLRFVFGSMIITAGLFLLTFMITTARSNEVVLALPTADAEPGTTILTSGNYDNSNAVTAGLSKMADSGIKALNSIENSTTGGFDTLSESSSKAGKVLGTATVRGSKYVAVSSFKTLTFIASGLANSIVFVVHVPIKVVGFAASTLSSNSIARPADNTEVPIIDTQLEALYAAKPTATKEEQASQAQSQPNPETAWPIHGRVTTKFGVPHRPYQVTHTGLDISSGNRSGVIGIKPFRSGKVLSVFHSKLGLGNHVVVDHGAGLTSVYAHLYSISVTSGQEVDTSTVLGLEGSTGVSTGTHLHFEVRLNGQPTDPGQYINGQP